MSGLKWFRAYSNIVDDDKLRLLAFEDRWHFMALCALKCTGLLDEPDSQLRSRKIAVKMGVQVRELEEIARRLQEVGLVDEMLNPSKWDDLQFRSDKSTERVKKYREKQHRNGLKRFTNVSETVQDTDTETDISEAKASSPRAWALPVGVSLQVWTDFLTNRKRKRLGNTPTAWKSFEDDLARVSAQTGIPPPQLIEQCTAKGWGAIYDPREQRNGPSNQPPGIGRTEAAAIAALGR